MRLSLSPRSPAGLAGKLRGTGGVRGGGGGKSRGGIYRVSWGNGWNRSGTEINGSEKCKMGLVRLPKDRTKNADSAT